MKFFFSFKNTDAKKANPGSVIGRLRIKEKILFLFYFGATSIGALGLFLALCLGIVPGGAQRSIWGAEDQIQVDSVQGLTIVHISLISEREV